MVVSGLCLRRAWACPPQLLPLCELAGAQLFCSRRAAVG